MQRGVVLPAFVGFISFVVWPDTMRAAQHEQFLARLKGPGGEVPFILEIPAIRPWRSVWILNGSQRIEVPVASTADGLRIEFPHYDSVIEATKLEERFVGMWKKNTGKNGLVEMPFSAERYSGFRFKPIAKIELDVPSDQPIAGRWAVKFSEGKEPAVGVFKLAEDGTVEGTFLTVTGDYGFLAGSYQHGRLRLSNFDGSHAFLFDAEMQRDGTLKGDFWSGTKWHETWSATRDDKAELPDGFGLVKATGQAKLAELKFPDLEGKVRSLSELVAGKRLLLIDVFGSWCPNCHDAAEPLEALQGKYAAKGLQVVGLAFERTGDVNTDGERVRTYIKRHGVTYPILLAGVADKKKVAELLSFLDSFKGYPTFIFMKPDGTVRSVYTGYAGPATGEEHQKLHRRFEELVEKTLSAEGG